MRLVAIATTCRSAAAHARCSSAVRARSSSVRSGLTSSSRKPGGGDDDDDDDGVGFDGMDDDDEEESGSDDDEEEESSEDEDGAGAGPRRLAPHVDEVRPGLQGALRRRQVECHDRERHCEDAVGEDGETLAV